MMICGLCQIPVLTSHGPERTNMSNKTTSPALCCCTDINTQATEGFQLMCSRSHGREDEDKERQPFNEGFFMEQWLLLLDGCMCGCRGRSQEVLDHDLIGFAETDFIQNLRM